MKFLLLFTLLPFTAFSQSLWEKSDKVYNVYRRDSAVIAGYNLEFAKSIKAIDSVVNKGMVSAYVTKLYPKKPCLGDTKIHVRIDIEAKDNRAKMTFNTVTYQTENDKCPTTGTLTELLDCKKCGLSSDFIKNDYLEYMQTIYEAYHKYLKSKSDDGNW